MLVIRNDQFGALLEQQDRACARQLAALARRDNPAVCTGLDDEQLAQELLAAIGKARRHGFREGADVAEYFAAARRFSARFDETPSVLRVLNDRGVPPCQRIYDILQLPQELVRQELACLPAAAGAERRQ